MPRRKTVKELNERERPRKKIRLDGAETLSDIELLAVVLGSGSRGRDVLSLARDVLRLLDSQRRRPTIGELETIPGIKEAKSSIIVAALEFFRRRMHPGEIQIETAVDVLPLLRHFIDRRQEYFFCVSLNGAREVLATRIVTVGTVDTVLVHPREVFADPITDRASAVVLAHNHPSGNVRPSEQDRVITRRLLEAGELLGLQVLDHIIFCREHYFSFAEHNLLRTA